MKRKLIASLALAVFIPGLALAQRQPNYTYKVSARKAFDVALRAALKNSAVTYISDDHLMFTFKVPHVSSSVLQEGASLNLQYTAYFEDNGEGGSGVFLNGNDITPQTLAAYRDFNSTMIYALTGKQDEYAQELAKKVQQEDQQNKLEEQRLKKLEDRLLKKTK